MPTSAAAQAVQRIRHATDFQGIGAGVRQARIELGQFPDEPVIQVALAEALLWSGSQNEALDLLEAVVREHPGCGEAFGLLATWHAMQFDLDKSREFAERARELAPRSREAREAMLNYLTVTGDQEGSARIAREIYADEPDSPSAWSALFYGLLCAGYESQATEMFETCLAIVRQSGIYYVAQARMSLRKLELKAGEAHARAAVEASPESDGAWSTLAMALESQGRLAEAADAARKALAINSKETGALRTLSNVLENSGEMGAALEARHNADVSLPFLSGDAAYFEVLDLIKDDELERALAKALEIEPSMTAANENNLRGTIYSLLRDLERWEDLEHRLSLCDEQDAEWCLYSAALARHCGRPEAASKILAEACERWPADHGLAAERIVALNESGEEGELVKAIDVLMEQPPISPAHITSAASALLEINRVADAYAVLGAGMNSFPDSEELQDLHTLVAMAMALDEAA